MSKEHYNAVRESDLYEYGGYRKSLLMQIAGLIIGPREEDAQGKSIGEPDPDEGWCVARQEVLAASIGCSWEEACREIAEFEADGWLTVDTRWDSFGHKRCRYTITPAQLKKIRARKMKRKKVNGIEHPIRANMPSQARKEKSRANIVKPVSGKRSHHKRLETPLDQPSRSPLTIGQEAHCPTVKKPLDQPSKPVVEPVLPSLGINSGYSSTAQEKPKSPQETFSQQGRKEKQNPPRPSSLVVLKDEVVTKLRAFGCPDSCLDLIQRHTRIATILNGETPGGCSNPVTAYATIAGRNPKFAKLWMPNLSGNKTLMGDSEQEVEAMVAMKKHRDSMPLEERDYESAQNWQMGFTLAQKDALGLGKAAPGHDGETCLNELATCKVCDAFHRKALVEAYTVAMRTGKGRLAEAWRREHGIPAGTPGETAYEADLIGACQR